MPAQPNADIRIEAPLPGRLASLDAFRGFAIAGMLFVNNPGTWSAGIVPAQLLHAEWHGCTFADLIFPFFLFIVGAAMPFSEARRIELGTPFWKCVTTAAKRAAILYLLGAFLASVALNRPVLYFGILQRIGVLYFITYLFLRLNIRWQGMIAVICLLVWWAFMAFGQAPGVLTGSFERDVNFAQYIDRLILPEGNKETVFSLVPGIATVLFGVMTGRFLMSKPDHTRVAAVLGGAGLAGIILGLLWHPLVPLNKILWTSSFAVFTAGWSCLVLLAFYWAIEVWKQNRLAFPFVVFGMNAIALYVLTGLFVRWIMLAWRVPYEGELTSLTGFFYRTFSAWTTPTVGSLMYSTMIVALAWLFGCWLYRKRIFLKV